QALTEALPQADSVVPVFILDPNLLSSEFVGQARLAFLFDGLRELDNSLKKRGSKLILRQGDPLEVLTSLLRETDAESIFAEEDKRHGFESEHRAGAAHLSRSGTDRNH
ncbi:MAG TPA: deoxyribodipyrimidine photo-lyase, partial [Prosthecobacter sp.]|nr:deoxyribodipyrimidine photo-lyase [Prosthecobacter sp.]